jgi:hypothetical protein
MGPTTATSVGLAVGLASGSVGQESDARGLCSLGAALGKMGRLDDALHCLNEAVDL